MNITGALVFLLDTVFSIYIAAVLIRVILQYVRAPFSNPISQFIVQITNVGFKLFRKFIPGFKGIDFAGIVFAYLLAMLKIIAIYLVSFASIPNLAMTAFAAIFLLLNLTLTIISWSIVIRIIFSFVQAGYSSFNPLSYLTYLITEPVLGPIRRMIPPIGGLDLSPVFAFLGISLLRVLFNL